MKLEKGKITILINREKTTIEVKDGNSSTTFAVIEMSPENFQAALARHGQVECEINVYALDRINKKLEVQRHVFPIPDDWSKYANFDKLKAECLRTCPEGWQPDNTYDSQNSFFYDKDGKKFAGTVIRRWV